MNVDNMKSQMRKGILEYCILLILYREPSYASDIIQRLKKAKLIIVEGTLYPLLTRLKNDEQLTYEWIESTQGPPRKYYRLTQQGELLLNELEKSWDDLTATVAHIKGTPAAAPTTAPTAVDKAAVDATIVDTAGAEKAVTIDAAATTESEAAATAEKTTATVKPAKRTTVTETTMVKES